ncbi:ribosomal protein S18 acetylase RimI-like enzyme [Paenibacillus taihuensis]|uniref:Ribosomal protein S18 acetylase RimI-like enzyme n=1 Tax=Paenibacillus taihuensis TaxID=1156355 RepID=A0A3D9S5L5_9BACL|nr:GNAT family N-acetyltransferase [Paenibacillus taihuensis]REE83852.1 ribosomal protein S18 acetylase RimI-like enzyme [Paenibacillus taihuensis]
MTAPFPSPISTDKLIVVPLSDPLAEQLTGWRYEPPFDFYNWSSWEVMQQLGMEFGDPIVRSQQYRAVTNKAGEMVGFAQFFPLLGVTRLGLGLRPDLCGHGRGLGLALVRAIVAEAERQSPGDEIDLEVHVWNERAIRTYERAGFVIADTYSKPTAAGPVDVHCMCYVPQAID